MKVVVTGANGLVGSRICAALRERDAEVVAAVRRPGSAPGLPGVEERVGDFTDGGFADALVQGADAVVTTVYPLGSDDRSDQERVSVDGTAALARAAAAAGVPRLVHVSTAAVYDRSPEIGDVDESGALVPDDAGDYAVVKRDTDAALAGVEGITRVLLRPPAILGPGESSVWNTLRPAHLRDDESARHVVAEATFSWVHVDDLARFAAEIAVGRAAGSVGPETGACTPVNVAAEPATQGDYYGAVAEALGVDLTWDDGPAWTGRLRTDRAASWGFTPSVSLADALAEVGAGLRA